MFSINLELFPLSLALKCTVRFKRESVWPLAFLISLLHFDFILYRKAICREQKGHCIVSLNTQLTPFWFSTDDVIFLNLEAHSCISNRSQAIKSVFIAANYFVFSNISYSLLSELPAGPRYFPRYILKTCGC